MYADIIHEGMKSGEFRDCEANRVADAMRSLVDALHFQELQLADSLSAADIDYARLRSDTEYILTLLINGLKRN